MNGRDIQIHKLVIVSGRSHSISEALTVLLAAGRVFYSSLINCCYMFVFFEPSWKSFFFLAWHKEIKVQGRLKRCPIKSSIFLTQMCVPLETNSSKFFRRKYFLGRLHFPPVNLCGFGGDALGVPLPLERPASRWTSHPPNTQKKWKTKNPLQNSTTSNSPCGDLAD